MYHLIAPGTPFPEPFPAGALLLIDKPVAWTSFDVVNKLRYLLKKRLGNKKLKVGHAGTLDPLATGLLLLCIGDHTRKIDTLQGMEKAYAGTITFGATTPSYDLEKAPDTLFPTAHITDALLDALIQQFTGDILQVPPMFSAVKVDGERLYKNARTGESVELPHRPVTIHSFKLGPLRPVRPMAKIASVISQKGADIWLHPEYENGIQCDFEVTCSKGTYIRSLAYDLGQAAHSGAYLSGLRRTKTGLFDADNAWSMDDAMAWIGGVE